MEIGLQLTKGQLVHSLIEGANRALYSAKRIELAPSGISFERLRVLWILAMFGRPTLVAELAPLLDRDNLTVGQLLRRMEKEDLLVRHQGRYKHNAIAWTLSEKGEENLRQSQEHTELTDDIFSVLSEDEQNNLIECLKKLRDEARLKIAVSPYLPNDVVKKFGL